VLALAAAVCLLAVPILLGLRLTTKLPTATGVFWILLIAGLVASMLAGLRLLWARADQALQQEIHRLEHRCERLSAVAEIGLAINEPTELRSVLERIVTMSQRLVGSSWSSILLWDQARESFVVSASTVPDQPAQSVAGRVRREGGATRWIVDHQRPVIVSDTKDDPFGANSLLSEYGVRAYAGVPLIAEGRAIGVLYALDGHTRSYSPDDLELMGAMASRAAAAVSKVALYERLSALNRSLHERTAQLRENERRFRMLADTAPVMIWMSGRGWTSPVAAWTRSWVPAGWPTSTRTICPPAWRRTRRRSDRATRSAWSTACAASTGNTAGSSTRERRGLDQTVSSSGSSAPASI
jgi:hypothetical protein